MEILTHLIHESGRLLLERPGQTPVRVRIAWARPISGRGQDIVFIDEAGKEVEMLPGLQALDPASRLLAEEELKHAYVIPRIMRVNHTETVFGTQYWDVETDMGRRSLAIKSDNRNAVWIDHDHLVLRDTLGCRYDIRPYSGLDAHSRSEIEKVM